MTKARIRDLIDQFAAKKKGGKKRYRRFSKKGSKKFMKNIIRGIVGFGIFVGIAIIIWFYARIIPNVPKLTVEGLDSLFSQTTTIVDKDGEELYKLFEQHRKNVEFDEISDDMIDAIIAVEDKSFWTNEGVDPYGILRAAVITFKSKIFGGGVQGASTITQQSVKNLLLTNDRNITRKVKEIVLALQLDNLLEADIKANNKTLSKDEIKRMKKERIMELYLNYIFMGNNAYGIESAANIYFNKPAKELDVIESAVIASIPKSPTRYNPYRKNGKLMGDIKVYNGGESVAISGDLKEHIYSQIEEEVMSSKVFIKKDTFLTRIEKIIDFTTSFDGENYTVSYARGRKDHVLNRMYTLGYITEKELKEEFIKGLHLEFTKSSITDIKAPHFIFYVQEFITSNPEFEKLGIDQESLLEGGYTIRTSIDNSIQEVAEASLIKYMDNVQAKGGSNRAMVYLDSKNGDILAYVGSADYNNKDIEGENDMVSKAKRQPGSSIKPFIYANLLQNVPSTIDTPIFDTPIKVGGLRPNNAEGRFKGLMPLKNALAHSRNIPAVRAYLAGGQEEAIKPYLQALGLTSLKTSHPYGYSLALGAGEVTMLEMAKAYMHISAMGRPAYINPILEIIDPSGRVIYTKEPKLIETPIMKPEVASLLWKILADKANMPVGWVGLFNVPGLPNMGVKSGTSNKVKANGQKVAGDGWVATFTPSKVAIFWAGNTDGSPMSPTAYGGGLNSPVMKNFYNQLLSKKLIKNESIPEVAGLSPVTISKISGKLANENTPEVFAVKTLAYNIPGQGDTPVSTFKFDTLCGGQVSEYTPTEETRLGYLIQPNSTVPGFNDLGDIISRWKQGNQHTQYGDVYGSGSVVYNYTYIFVEEPEDMCEERIPKEDPDIELTIHNPENQSTVAETFTVSYDVRAPRSIEFVKVLINNDVVKEIAHNRQYFSHSEKVQLFKDKYSGKVQLTIIAIDNEGFSNRVDRTISIGKDTDEPYLDLENTTITKLASGQYKVVLKFLDKGSAVNGGSIKFSENTSRLEGFKKDTATFTVNTLQPIGYMAKDLYGNKGIDLLRLQDHYNESEEPTEEEEDETFNEILDALGDL